LLLSLPATRALDLEHRTTKAICSSAEKEQLFVLHLRHHHRSRSPQGEQFPQNRLLIAWETHSTSLGAGNSFGFPARENVPGTGLIV
jgi:hypothetical protein